MYICILYDESMYMGGITESTELNECIYVFSMMNLCIWEGLQNLILKSYHRE